jgi:5-(carboxyamino)imidazole ribonucleotide synthase
VAVAEFCGPYEDASMNAAFAARCDAITSEFENLPTSLLDFFADHVPVHPSATSLSICQHRRREKEFLRAHTIPCAAFEVVTTVDELVSGLDRFDGQAILKSAAFGYDGKGQHRFTSADPDRAGSVWASFGTDEAVLEQLVPFVRELSVVGARSVDGSWVPFAPGENVHRNGILDYTIAAGQSASHAAVSAQRLAGDVAAALGHVGVLGVELFELADGSLLVNEMAPRPHNSGHHTIEACVTSQFGQQWRAALEVPLGDPAQHSAAVMCNLLGDLWVDGPPRFEKLPNHPRAYLHLYGKSEARPGRKMGHLTVLTDDPEEALAVRTTLFTP